MRSDNQPAAAEPLNPRAQIRAWAIDRVTRSRAREIVDPANYFVRREVRVVDGDCDYIKRAPQYVVYYQHRARWAERAQEHAMFDRATEAHAWIAERCSALDDADWAWSDAPTPSDFDIHG